MRVGFRIAVVLVCAACGGGTGGDGSTSIPSVSITVTPAAVSLATGATQQLAAVVTGAADTSVAWSVGEGAVGGDVSASGLYTAPASAGTFHVVATSNADRTKSATVTATVTARQPLPTVRVSIDPTSVSLHVGETTTFHATVTGTTDTEVAWSADGGAVDQAGLFTAPSSPATVHVTARSHANATQSATATVVVSPAGVVVVAISVAPQTASVQAGATQQFSATVTGATDTLVAWSIAEGSQGGSISNDGLYTAPATAGTFHVVATSHADASKSATAEVAVSAIQPRPVSISISPQSASIQAGATQQFSATVSGTQDLAVTWSADGGTVDATGRYAAPSNAGTFHVTATSHADTSKSATATVTVTVPSGGVSVTIRPASITINESTGVTFTATVAGAQDTSVTWSLREGLSGGFFDQRGNYTSPADVGVFHLAATSNADPGAFATAAITVTYPYNPEETLVDHGGGGVASVRLFSIWWGDPSAFAPDARAVQEDLFRTINGSGYLGLINQYMNGATATVSYAGSLSDPTPPPSNELGMLADEACNLFDANEIAPQAGDAVMINSSDLPSGMTGCAFHMVGNCHGHQLLVGYVPNALLGCGNLGQQCGNRNSTAANATVHSATHELMEIMTDPFGNGWYGRSSPTGGEIADECNTPVCVQLANGIYGVPSLYSNAARACASH